MIPVRGVRNSWPTRDKNSVFICSTSRSRRRSLRTSTRPTTSPPEPRRAPEETATGISSAPDRRTDARRAHGMASMATRRGANEDESSSTRSMTSSICRPNAPAASTPSN